MRGVVRRSNYRSTGKLRLCFGLLSSRRALWKPVGKDIDSRLRPVLLPLWGGIEPDG
jgi:hypothetical protein